MVTPNRWYGVMVRAGTYRVKRRHDPIGAACAQPRTSGARLQIEGRGLYGFLLIAGRVGQAVGERVGDAEVHACSGRQREKVRFSHWAKYEYTVRNLGTSLGKAQLIMVHVTPEFAFGRFQRSRP